VMELPPCERSTPLIRPSSLLIELSASSWLVAARVPGSDEPHLHRIDGGNTVGLLALISSLRDRVARRLNVAIGVVCCFEAGRDGFWLHHLLTVHGVANYVLEPTGILINRRARRAKTDRLDAVGMLRCLRPIFGRIVRAAAWYVCPHQMRKMPSAFTVNPRAWSRRGCASETALASFLEARSFCPAHRRWTRDAAPPWGRIGPPASTARHDLWS
jgi:hypothetical protein